MSKATPLTRDDSSAVNCFAIHRTSSHVSIRASKQFAEILRRKTENCAPGFAGVVLMEVGNGWYQLCSRDTLRHRDVEVDDATAQLFLEYAFIELCEMLETIDQDVVIGLAPTVSTPLREVRELRVVGSLSSRVVPPRLSANKYASLKQHFGRRH